MSKFYAYKELRERFPTKEAVSEARNRVETFISEISKRSSSRNAVVFGSAVWGTHPRIGDQHTRRSDVDVAIGQGYAGEELEKLCAQVTEQTGVPTEFTKVGIDGGMYDKTCFISPSTADHFRLLAGKFPKKPYEDFKKTMEVLAIPRAEDITNYVGRLSGNIGSDFHDLFVNRRHMDWTNPENLKLLAKLENFPDHFIRKILGMEKMLPCPDSKQVVWEVFSHFPYQWVAKEKLAGHFRSMRGCSAAYEKLIDEVSAGLSDWKYDCKFENIANDLILNAAACFSMIGHTESDLERILHITRIPKGTPVIILTHFGDGGGWVNAKRLDEDFGNPKAGVKYFVKNDPATPYEQKQYGQTEIPYFGGDNGLQRIDDPINPSRGWFTYKRSGSGFCSIRACDEATFQNLKGDLDKDDPDVRRAHYRSLANQALNPEYSRVPRKLLNRSAASV